MRPLFVCLFVCCLFVFKGVVLHTTIEVVTVHLCGWCMLGAFLLLYSSVEEMNVNLECLRLNACMFRTDLG